MSVNNFIERLNHGEVVVMDGGCGTEISSRGEIVEAPLWSANALRSQEGRTLVRGIHIDYFRAGAEFAIADTFGTQAYKFDKIGKKDEAAVATLTACELIKEARLVAGTPNAVIAGSLAPLEDCYTPKDTPNLLTLYTGHTEHAESLAEGKVDIILAETMITVRETRAALRAGKDTGLPVAVSFCCREDGKTLLSGESLIHALSVAETFEPTFIGINCVDPPIATRAIQYLAELDFGRPLAVYAQGDDHTSPVRDPNITDYRRHYQEHLQLWLEAGALLVGGCCGTTPEDIREISTQVSLHNQNIINTLLLP